MSEQKGATVQEWLALLDSINPTEDAWRDPEFIRMISWVMIQFLPRRLCQRLIDTGMCEPGSYIRDANAE